MDNLRSQSIISGGICHHLREVKNFKQRGRLQKRLEILVIYADNGSGMFSMGLKELLPQVITSWQVWVTILALVIYMYLVGYVSRTHHRPPRSKTKRKKKEKVDANANAEPTITEEESGSAA